jgi:hypothetical protein
VTAVPWSPPRYGRRGGDLGPEHLDVGPLPPIYAKKWEASGRSFPVLSVEGWKIMIDAYAEARAPLPRDQWLGLQFEDVLADPRSRFREMSELMGLEEDGAFAAALDRTSFSADRRDAFRGDLDTATIAKLEASRADHLRLWGYSRGCRREKS